MEQLLTDYAINHYIWHTFRVNDAEITLKKMADFAKEFEAPLWVVGHELSQKKVLHSHVVLGMKRSKSDYKMDKAIKTAFDIEKGAYSKSQVKSTIYRAIQYTVKDGDYKRSKTFPKKLLKAIYTASTRKYQKDEFAALLYTLECEFYNGKLSMKTFARKYGRMRLQYGQKPNKVSMKRYIQYHMFKNQLEDSDDFMDVLVQEIKSDLIPY